MVSIRDRLLEDPDAYRAALAVQAASAGSRPPRVWCWPTIPEPGVTVELWFGSQYQRQGYAELMTKTNHGHVHVCSWQELILSHSGGRPLVEII